MGMKGGKMDAGSLRESVRGAYSAAARQPGAKHPFPVGAEFAASVGYPGELLAGLPAEASEAFAGVSNVSMTAPIGERMTVLDLGCGAGLDSLIAAGRMAGTGVVVGCDFSEEMLARAQAAASKAGAGRVHWVQSAAERLPLRDCCADVALVNGLFNLNPLRWEIFGELARVLKPGGWAAGAELVLREPLPEEMRAGAANWFS